MPLSAQRVAAFLGLQRQVVPRAYVAETLWPETTTIRSHANLRSALWRLQRSCHLLVESSMQSLRLARGVNVDFHHALTIARRLVDRTAVLTSEELTDAVRTDLSADLLPHWYDDEWILVERERFHQLRLHALEALCAHLALAGRFAESVEVGLAAVSAEPLRESAHRALIQVHLAEGNPSEAARQYERYRQLLMDELQIEPSASLRDLVWSRRSVRSWAPHG
jgi:DNA-binding SARP family transcriptional activator